MIHQKHVPNKNSQKRIFWFPAGRKIWFDIASQLELENVATPVLWFGDDKHFESAKARFPEAEVISFNQIGRSERVVPPANATCVPEDFWKGDVFLRVRDQAFKLMQREDHLDDFNLLERDAYFHELVFWAADKVVSLRPDALVMAESPHSTPQFVLYAVAEAMGVDVFCFVFCPIVPGLLLRSGLSGHFFPLPESMIDRGRYIEASEEEIKRYLGDFSKDGYEFLPRYMKIQANVETSSTQFRKQPWVRKVAQFVRTLFSPRRIRAAIKRNELKTELQKVASEKPQGQYVYFPLHYEPERTTTPDGGIFHDQLRALALLRALVPPNIKIAVKEHPSTLSSFMNGHLGRHPRHYSAISKVAGVHLLSTEISSAEILRSCVAVATITGTVGIEGVALGKPALVFGNAWYSGCPGVAQYSSELTWESFLADEVPSRDQLQEWFLETTKKHLIPGTVNPSNERYYSNWYQSGLLSDYEIPCISATLRAVLSR